MARVVLVASPITQTHGFPDQDPSGQIIGEITQTVSVRLAGWQYSLKNSRASVHDASRDMAEGVALRLSHAETDAVYRKVCCGMLWPVLHGRPDMMQYDAVAFASYVEANRKLAQVLRCTLEHDDVVWVHGYQNIPLGRALREMDFSGSLGILLHTPMPAAPGLLTFPHSRDLISDLQCYNLVGFQSQNCLNNFREAVRSLGIRHDLDRNGGADARPSTETAVFPLPNNAKRIADVAASAESSRKVRYLRKCSGYHRLITSWSTSDYTQGLSNRLQGFERLLESEPRLCGEVSMIQLVVPFREWLEENQAEILEGGSRLAQINGRLSTLEWTPIKYIFRPPGQAWSIALKRASRVGLITPLSEGMSLAAKDFVAAQDPDDPGVLLLSRFAGGCDELSQAILVNPYDPDHIAQAISLALDMSREERKARWIKMFHSIEAKDLASWCNRFLETLASASRLKSHVNAA